MNLVLLELSMGKKDLNSKPDLVFFCRYILSKFDAFFHE